MFELQTKIALRAGDPGAFRELFRLMYPRMKGYCKLFVSDENEMKDLIQECLIALWEKRNEIDPQKPVESLLFVMLRNRCLNYLKKKKSEEARIDLENLQIKELQHLYQLDFMQREAVSIEEQLVISFRQAVDTLPDKMRYVFIKCKIEGVKQKELADELGVSLKTVEKHIATAKKHISEKLAIRFPALLLLISFWIE